MAGQTPHDDAIKAGSANRPVPTELAGKFQYGTAGFRMKANVLDSVVYRVGLLAALRSRKYGGQTIGVMITASHNPPSDNGVKIVDPMGDMIDVEWELHATELANAMTDDKLVQVYNSIAKEHSISLDAPARVIYARDTRASGSRLVECLTAALKAANCEALDFKLATTPQLHYYTRAINTKNTREEYGEPTETGYYEKLANAFKEVMRNAKPRGKLTVDCANGVGGPKLRQLLKYLPTAAEGGIDVNIVNDHVHKPDDLNHNCGADYVKSNQRLPPSSKASAGERCCSLDGDADRIVYYFVDDETGKFRLLDGDRIATLVAAWLIELIRQAGLSDLISLGVVQTAYANGASTKYINKTLDVPVVCTNTGVKHLHHAAQSFSIGVYFEANGHGTVLFSPDAYKTIHTREPKSPSQEDALMRLIGLTALINQTTGDALSDLLLVEAVLANKPYTVQEWVRTYDDLPNRLAKVLVPDRNAFKTVPGTAERRLDTPEHAQAEIDAVVSKYHDGRSFVRASGTEDAVRVYAEALSETETEDLCRAVQAIVRRYGGSNGS